MVRGEGFCHHKCSSLWESTPAPDLLLPRVFQHMASILCDLRSDLPEQRREDLHLIVDWVSDCQTAVSSTPSKNVLGWDQEVSSEGRRQIHSEMLLSAFLASRNMSSKDRDKIEDTVRHCITASVPPALRGAVLQAMRPSFFPGKESIRQAQLTLDAALCLYSRKANIIGDAPAYLWCDATTMGYDWLLSQTHSVQPDSLIGCFQAAQSIWLNPPRQPHQSRSAHS